MRFWQRQDRRPKGSTDAQKVSDKQQHSWLQNSTIPEKEAEREEALADVVRLVDAVLLPLPSPDTDRDWLLLPARQPITSVQLTQQVMQQENDCQSANSLEVALTAWWSV